MSRSIHNLLLAAIAPAMLLPTIARAQEYTLAKLGRPENASSAVAVRMNNLGHVAGWSQYFGQGEPSLRPWVWTPEDGFTILPPAPTFLGRARAMDISDNGIVGGDGGFDSGLAWRFQDGEYTVTGNVAGMPIAYLGGINEWGDLAGTAKDSQIITDDHAWLDINGGEIIDLTPDIHGRATDVNNARQVAGYLGGFEAFRWTQESGIQLLGTLDLARSFGYAINEPGDIVGTASSANGNTTKAWIWTEAGGQQQIPAPISQSTAAVGINSERHVVGTSDISAGFAWLWTGGSGVTGIATLFDAAAANINVLGATDINDAGQILGKAYDNTVGAFTAFVLTPVVECAGDTDGDQSVGVTDLINVVNAWGQSGAGLPADLTGDGRVNVADLITVITNWGECG